MTNKTQCPVSLSEFGKAAQPMAVRVGTVDLVAEVKAPFSTGSFGWNTNAQVVLQIGGKPVKCQVGLNITAIGSKEAKRS